MWSLGALLELNDREKMEAFLFTYKKEHGGINLPEVNQGIASTNSDILQAFSIQISQYALII